MREILFRGKRTYDGEWVIGDGIHLPKSVNYKGTYWIDGRKEKANDWIHVIPDTIGQYTGLTDKNGKRIFEGDVVTGLLLYALPINGRVGFRDGAFGLYWMRGNHEEFTPFTSMCHVEHEIIGNIHDNPELLGGEAHG